MRRRAVLVLVSLAVLTLALFAVTQIVRSRAAIRERSNADRQMAVALVSALSARNAPIAARIYSRQLSDRDFAALASLVPTSTTPTAFRGDFWTPHGPMLSRVEVQSTSDPDFAVTVYLRVEDGRRRVSNVTRTTPK